MQNEGDRNRLVFICNQLPVACPVLVHTKTSESSVTRMRARQVPHVVSWTS